ncbi:MAG TPA: hypothetical protein V6C85_34450 [Allocoleopsis sp.]
MRKVRANFTHFPSQITGLQLAASCNWDGEKILEIAAVALTDADCYAEASQVQVMLFRVRGGQQSRPHQLKDF